MYRAITSLPEPEAPTLFPEPVGLHRTSAMGVVGSTSPDPSNAKIIKSPSTLLFSPLDDCSGEIIDPIDVKF
nr:hypothetical protein CFP56_11415 [Quercus suber]